MPDPDDFPDASAALHHLLSYVVAAAGFGLEGEGRQPFCDDGLAPWATGVLTEARACMVALERVAHFLRLDLIPPCERGFPKPAPMSAQVHGLLQELLREVPDGPAH